jgi:cation transport regulator ChaB
MNYLENVDKELEVILRELPEETRKQLSDYLKNTIRDSFKNGLSAGMRRGKSGAYAPAVKAPASE